MLLDLGPELCSDYPAALSREWLETNGLGGFASGTLAGPGTRRYHGLLVAALKPPLERRVLLAGLDEVFHAGGKSHALSSHEFPGAIHPDGFQRLARFRLDPWPIWTYRCGNAEVEREVLMLHGEHTVIVRYRARNAAAGATLELRPFLAYRDYHALTHENAAAERGCQAGDGLLGFQLYPGFPRLWLGHSPGAFRHAPDWFRRFEYRIERERGLDFQEDLFTPGILRIDLPPGGEAGFAASLDKKSYAELPAAIEKERRRREAVTASVPGAEGVTRRLLLAADAFPVQRGSGGRSVIAGYPWFGDWGRDTLIALPGLCLATRRFDDARAILRSFAAHIDRGMIPNRFPDEGETPEYNTIDATLWYFHAAHRYLEATGDLDLIRELLPAMEEMVRGHLEGPRFGIHVDADGLLTGGEPGVQLTWMDAKVGGWVVTPRMGKPVEIAALWYNALRFMEDFEKKTGRALEALAFGRRAERARRAFAAFWNAERGCLFDVLGPDGRGDPALRPNQIFALALPHRPLPPEQERAVLRVVTERLLTPYGLRSLAPGEPGYRGRYSGGPAERDGAYHQGTVWAWLIGPYIDACLAVEGGGPETRARLARLLDPLLRHLDEAGLNGVSEIFDGDPPHAPQGCFTQAWSVGELLRVYARLQGGLDSGASRVKKAQA